MHRSEFIESITTWLWEPLLIRPPGWLPLNNFSSIISTLSSDIEAKPIESTFNHNAFPLFLKMPSLIPSFVLLPLYQPLASFSCCSRDVKGFPTHVVDEQSATLECVIIYLLKPKKLRFTVRIKLTKSEDSFQRQSLVAFQISLNPVIFVESLYGGNFNGEELIFALFTLLQPNLIRFFIKN